MIATDAPRIYVASLSDYNAGILHGRWIDAAQDTGAILAEVDAMLAASPTAKAEGSHAEEWAIHDYEGFGDIRLGEWESFDKVATLALAIEEHGEPFVAWWNNYTDRDVDTAGEFLDAYRGIYDTEADFAQELAEDLLPEPTAWPWYCIDWGQAWRELEIAGDYWSERVSGGVAIFNTYY